jgi:hypothetical protein
MQRQLGEAGFAGVRTLRLIPGQAYYAFVATYDGKSPLPEVPS